MEEDRVIRVGSRKSELALIQTKHVIGQLQALFPHRKFEIHTMSTVGDRVLNISLPKIGEKSLFTKDLEDALRTGKVDFVVHSLKDLPTTLPDGMAIGAVLEREDPRDALVLHEKHRGKTLKTLPEGSVIGTSSLRRAAQLARFYPQLTVCDIRGNLNTRLAKLDADNSKFAGIILAQAGLVRMGWEKRISQVLKCDELLYAVGQGALAVECRSDAEEILGMLQKLCCRTTEGRILAERSFLRTLGGGCSAPVAVTSSLKRSSDREGHHKLTLRGAVWSLDGKTEIRDEISCEIPWDESQQEVEGVPPKRAKVAEAPARRSPDIIDDSKAGGATENLDIGALINLHGEAFKRCPYSKQQQPHERCPLSIPIGQDVMGVCPFFDTTQKVNLAEEFGPEHRDVGNGGAKCPVSGHRVIPEAPPIEKCPFLANQVKLIDCDAENATEEHNGEHVVEPQATVPLFCGLFRHTSVPEVFLAKSEAVGKQLADTLIAKGAMEVMSKAQDEIRGKV